MFLKVIAEADLNADWTLSGFAGLRAVFDRSAWNWKPAPGAAPNDPSGLTTELDDYQKLDAGVSLSYKGKYKIFVNVYNALGQDIENLDDLYTVIDGKPVAKVGLECRW